MKTKTIWREPAGILFKEEIDYSMIPPVGRKFVWLTLSWKVVDVIENFDEKFIDIIVEMQGRRPDLPQSG